MPDILDVDPLNKFMALFTGHSGSGKSIAIGSWKKKGSIYYFDFDGRMASVATWYKGKGLKRGQLEYDTYGPDNLFDALTKLDNFLSYCPHAAVVIDSFTAVTISAVTFQLKRRAGKGGNFVPKTTKGDMIIPDWDEYKGEVTCVTQMLDLCKSLAAKGVAIFWTAHPVTSTKIEGDKYLKQTRYAAFGFKTDSLIPIYFNEVYHFTTSYDYSTSRVERHCFTRPDGEVVAKTAFQQLPTSFKWTDGDFYDIFSSLIYEGGDTNEVTLT